LYNELYEAWKKEKENVELQALPKDFYAKLAQYVKKVKAEGRMLDEKTTKAKLLIRESKNVQKMLGELLMLRHEKTVNKVSDGETVSSEGLTSEEEKLVKEVSPSFESFQTLLKNILSGRLPQVEVKHEPKKRVLRFLKEIPAIIGADMKTYGPFKPEDVASLPLENAKILTKQGIAVEVEVKRNAG
jgi:DNA replication factor GINS